MMISKKEVYPEKELEMFQAQRYSTWSALPVLRAITTIVPG
jgi:hypothetical protein